MTRLAAGLLTTVALAGCSDPYSQDARQARPPGEAAPSVGDARPPRAEPGPAAPGAARRPSSPRGAARRFAAVWANWSYRTIERQQRRLSRLATGSYARALAAEADERASNGTLTRDRFAVRGDVIAVDIYGNGGERAAIVVTREEQIVDSHASLDGGAHRIYLATLKRTTTGWAVSAWEPQP